MGDSTAKEAASTLSEREMQIVELVTVGMTNQEISDDLAISKRTVDNHISNILTKTSTSNRVELVRWALQWGKVCIDQVNCCTLPPYKPESSSSVTTQQDEETMTEQAP